VIAMQNDIVGTGEQATYDKYAYVEVQGRWEFAKSKINLQNK
jgi:hypothetical protein